MRHASREGNVAQVEAGREATAKIFVDAGVGYIRGTLDTVTGSSLSNDMTRLPLGARNLATRNVTLDCNFLRDSGSATAGATVCGCWAEFVLR